MVPDPQSTLLLLHEFFFVVVIFFLIKCWEMCISLSLGQMGRPAELWMSQTVGGNITLYSISDYLRKIIAMGSPLGSPGGSYFKTE